MRLRGFGNWPRAAQLLVAERVLSPAPGCNSAPPGLAHPRGCSGPGSVLGCICPELWGCGGSCQGRNLTPPPGASPPPHSQSSNSGEKRRCTAPLEFISILILGPRFQWIIKSLFNYKQNICAFSPSELRRAWRGVRSSRLCRNGWPGVSLQFLFPAHLNQDGLPAGAKRKWPPPLSPLKGVSVCPGHPPAQSPDKPLPALPLVLLDAGSCSDTHPSRQPASAPTPEPARKGARRVSAKTRKRNHSEVQAAERRPQ